MGLCLSKKDALGRRPLSLREQMLSDLAHDRMIVMGGGASSPSISSMTSITGTTTTTATTLGGNNRSARGGGGGGVNRRSGGGGAMRFSFASTTAAQYGSKRSGEDDDEEDEDEDMEFEEEEESISNVSSSRSPMIQGIDAAYGMENIARSYARFHHHRHAPRRSSKLVEIDEEGDVDAIPPLAKKTIRRSLHVFGEEDFEAERFETLPPSVFKATKVLGYPNPQSSRRVFDSWRGAAGGYGSEATEEEEDEVPTVMRSKVFMAVPPHQKAPSFAHMNKPFVFNPATATASRSFYKPAAPPRSSFSSDLSTTTYATDSGDEASSSSAFFERRRPKYSSFHLQQQQNAMQDRFRSHFQEAKVHPSSSSGSSSRGDGGGWSAEKKSFSFTLQDEEEEEGNESDDSNDLFEIANLEAAVLNSLSSASDAEIVYPKSSATAPSFLKDPDISKLPPRPPPSGAKGFYTSQARRRYEP